MSIESCLIISQCAKSFLIIFGEEFCSRNTKILLNEGFSVSLHSLNRMK